MVLSHTIRHISTTSLEHWAASSHCKPCPQRHTRSGMKPGQAHADMLLSTPMVVIEMRRILSRCVEILSLRCYRAPRPRICCLGGVWGPRLCAASIPTCLPIDLGEGKLPWILTRGRGYGAGYGLPIRRQANFQPPGSCRGHRGEVRCCSFRPFAAVGGQRKRLGGEGTTPIWRQRPCPSA